MNIMISTLFVLVVAALPAMSSPYDNEAIKLARLQGYTAGINGFRDCEGALSTGNFYRYISVLKSHSEAQQHCRTLRARLAEPKILLQNNCINSIRQQELVWLGFSDVAEEGKFVGADGVQIASHRWSAGQPDNQNDQDCVLMWNRPGRNGGPGGWDDQQCHVLRHFVCQI